MDKYYIYFHKLSDGSIFYIGKGSGSRFKNRYDRNKMWNKITKENDWYYEIYKDNLSEDEALNLELELIKEFCPKANVRTAINRSKQLDKPYILDNYEYDENSPTGLSYKVRNGKRKVGKYGGAGFLSSGYYKVKGTVDGKNAAVHRIIWFLITGDDPNSFVIDHIDGNTLNNKIQNLRKVSCVENARNAGTRRDNSSGINGVKERNDCYESSWKDAQGNAKCKVFSKIKYGKELSLELAVYNRMFHLKELGYSERHLGSFNFKILNTLDHESVNEMLKDSSRQDNTSGFTGVSRLIIGTYVYWVFKVSNQTNSRFSVLRFGEDLARKLAVESRRKYTEGFIVPIDNYSHEETERMVNTAKLPSCLESNHIYLTGDVLHLLINNKQVFISKKRSVKKHGYDKALSELIKIRDSYLKES